MATQEAETIAFKAEIQQLLDILVHSLYTEREVFLRELVSNASDALHRFKLESLTSQRVYRPESELGIWITPDEEAGTLVVRDTGVGMTKEELIDSLGTIAHSGARGFVEAMQELKDGGSSGSDVIGRFGVGFYSVFMVAEEVTVTSRSFKPQAKAWAWHSEGQGSYRIAPAEMEERGTRILIRLKDDAHEFLSRSRLRQIIKTHSDFVSFPIYLSAEPDVASEGATEKGFEQVNQRLALWREPAGSVSEDKLHTFYRQLTFDGEAPLATLHTSADVPIQFYTLLFVPSARDVRPPMGPDDYGLRLYARKVLIQERFKDLLPPYLRFVEGVVDSEDLPLNVSREAVQATPVVTRIRRVLVGRVTSQLERMAEDDPERYREFFREFGTFLKEGIASDPTSHEALKPLLRFDSTRGEGVSFADYRARMPASQEAIYYVLGDAREVVERSAHLEAFRAHDLEVLLLTDPVDSFMLMGLGEVDGKPLRSIDEADLELPDTVDADPEAPEEARLTDDAFGALLARVGVTLGERIEAVRESRLLRESPARLVSGGVSSLERAQRLMNRDFQGAKRILELNRANGLIGALSSRLEADRDDPLIDVLIEQLFENQLLMEGLHDNPAEMVGRIERLMAAAAGSER